MSSNSGPLSLQTGSDTLAGDAHAMPQDVLLDGIVASEILSSSTREVPSAGSPTSTIPWYKRPSPTWILVGTFVGAMAYSATIAPRVEIFIKLACQEIRPEYNTLGNRYGGGVIDWPGGIGAVTIPRPSTKCQADPEVQQAAAELGATMTTIMGTLSCLTAGWWGKFSDHYGRLKVLAITLLGVLVADLTFISVALCSTRLPGGYRFLVVAPIIEGLLGGIATGSVATHAYLSDTTTPATRSRIFSLMLGLLFCGMAVGPTLGGLLISSTNDILSVFYAAATLHATYSLLALFIVPESLTREKAKANGEQARQRAERERAARSAEDTKPDTFLHRIVRLIGPVFFFLRPLAVVLPHKIERTGKKDWNLTILAISYGMGSLLSGSYQFKFQYASYTFGWTSQQLGYWLSVIGIMRAIYLIIILPAAIKFFHPNRRSNQIPSNDDPGRSRGLPHDPAFDLIIARISLGVELCQYILTTLSTNITLWTSATLISSFGSGFSPSAQALAVELSNRKEAILAGEGRVGENYGQLFGALGVIQALCSQMLGPLLFGSVFVGTIDHYPKGIFVTGGIITFFGLIFLSFIRVPRTTVDPEREPLLSHEREGSVIHED